MKRAKLIIMLVVAIPIWLSLIWPVIQTQRRKNLTEKTVRELSSALELYFQTRSRFPVEASQYQPGDIRTDSHNPKIIEALVGDRKQLQPWDSPVRMILFNPPDAVSESAPGLYYTDEGPILNDVWGNPYQIVLDTNNNGEIAVPDGAGGMLVLKAKVKVWMQKPTLD